VRKACRSVVRSVSLEMQSVNVDAIIGLVGSGLNLSGKTKMSTELFHLPSSIFNTYSVFLW
jgi:hypothetical protein